MSFWRSSAPRAAAVAAALLAVACASEPVHTRQLADYDGLSRRIFVAYYPELTPDQRHSLLNAEADPYLLLQYWKIDTRFFQPVANEPPIFLATPENYTLRDVVVETKPGGPLKSGTEAELRARLDYLDGRRADATEQVSWQVNPAIATVDGRRNRLEFECVHSDVVVSANFLGAALGQATVELRKPVRSVEIRLTDPSSAVDGQEVVSFEAIAHCEDGTSTVVTCQADWGAASAGLQAQGCGHFLLRQHEWELPRITATYGGKVATRTFELPRRRAF